jgi:PAS domain S-box-containing protein
MNPTFERDNLLPWREGVNAVAVAILFAAITGMRFWVDEPGEGIGFLYVVPITLLTLQYGRRGALAGTGVAFALFTVWDVNTESEVGATGYAVRLFVYAGPAAIIAYVLESRTRARSELADNASLLQAISENLPDTLYVKDNEGRYVLVNAAGAAVSGHAPEEVIGRTDEELLPREAAEVVLEADRQLEGVIEPVETTGGVELADGYHVFRALRGPLFSADGSMRGHFGLVRDVTEEHRHESYLRIQHQIAERLVTAPTLDELPDMILSELVRAKDVQWAAYWSKRSKPGHFRCVAVVGDDPPIRVGEERELGGVPEGWHVGWREPRGEAKGPTALIPAPPAGVAMVGYRSRVPDPETIEAVFKPTMLMVANYVERTLLAEETERTKNDFFGLISHELRTPLTSIIGYTELLEEIESEALSSQAKGFIDVIDRNARRELRLVQDLLLLVRLEGGGFTLERDATDLRALVEHSCQIVRPQAEAKGVRIVVDLGETGELWVDPHRIGQAVDNLLTNAIKFSDADDEIEVRIEIAGEEVVIEVADQGIGVPEHEVGRLFERLYRASSAVDRQIQGTGLGLTIVKSVVEAHGGSVSVASEENVGTKVSIRLPLVRRPGMEVGMEIPDKEERV